MASTDRPPLIRPSVPAQRAGDARPVSLAKRRVSLAKRRVSLAKQRVEPGRPVTRPPSTGPGPGLPPRRRALPTPTRVFAAAGTGATRGVRATRDWARRPSGRTVLPGMLMAILVVLGAVGGAWLPRATGADPVEAAPEQSDVPSAGPEAPGVPDEENPIDPDGTGTGTPGPGRQPADTLAAWAAPMAVRTGIPLVALEAYALAELTVTQSTPACGLRWTTLAGIGRNESNHGRTNNATLTNDGRSTPPIYGPPLDGTGGTKSIPDTDSGRLDGDTTWDRAVGPMQFIPTSWSRYAADADANGQADPHDIHDAALAAANHLCAGGQNMSTGAGWRAAILAYNNVETYANNVFQSANDYGVRSRG